MTCHGALSSYLEVRWRGGGGGGDRFPRDDHLHRGDVLSSSLWPKKETHSWSSTRSSRARHAIGVRSVDRSIDRSARERRAKDRREKRPPRERCVVADVRWCSRAVVRIWLSHETAILLRSSMIHPPLDDGPVAVGTFHRVCRRAARAPTRADTRPPCPRCITRRSTTCSTR